MEYDHTISGLRRKRGEIAQAIVQSGRELSDLHRDLATIDGALLIFGVTETPQAIRPYKRRFERSEIQRLIYAEIRLRPVTVDKIVGQAIALKGLEADSLSVRKAVERGVRNALAKLESMGRVERDGDSWRMVRP